MIITIDMDKRKVNEFKVGNLSFEVVSNFRYIEVRIGLPDLLIVKPGQLCQLQKPTVFYIEIDIE